MNSIVQVLMNRDGLSEKEAVAELTEYQIRIREGEDPEDILEELGLEPDYLEDLL